MTSRMVRHPFLVTVAVLTLVIASTVFTVQPALASANGGSRSTVPVHASRAQANTAHVAGPLDANTSCPWNSWYSTCDGFDVSGSQCGFIDGSWGAYWVGNFPGDYSWLQVWWARGSCNSNFIYVFVPQPNTLCNGYACQWVGAVSFLRTDSQFSAGWCNASPANDASCSNFPNPCYTPGNCPTDASLSFCAHQWYTCSSTFNGEWIGYSSWWTSFVTDMLYAPNQPVKACVWLIRTDPGGGNRLLCSQWH